MPIRIERVRALMANCTHRSEKVSLFLFAITAAAILLVASTATAAERQHFNIEAGPAAQSLNEYALQAGVELGFRREDMDALRTNPVKGRYSPEAALRLMLDGTGLTTRSDSRGVTIVELAADGDSEAARATATRRGSERTHLSAAEADSEASSKGAPLEEILVTGTRIRGASGASPLVTITRQDINRAGFATVEDLVDKLPQNFGAGASNDRFTDARGSSNVVDGNVGALAGGSSINLRGLGASSTLVLINGRRPSPSGLDAQFVDVSSIPITAIKRVEVLTDGASAIYGADAIAGVVNFVLRRDYEGAETRARFGYDTEGDTSETVFGQSLGLRWGSGNAMAFYEYYRHGNLHNTDRTYSASTDLTALGGSDWRTAGGNPANITAGGETYAIPGGQDGASLTAADFDPATPLNLHDIRAGEDFLPEQERHSVFVNLAQAVGQSAELFAEARISVREHTTRIDHGLISLTVPDSNPFFVDPSGTGQPSVTVSNYSFRDDLGPILNKGESDAYGAVLGLDVGLGETWRGEIVGTYAQEDASATFHNLVNRVQLEAALAASDHEQALNPFGDGSHTSPSVLESLRTGGNKDATRNRLWTAGVHATGDAARLPGGPAKLAAGLEYRQEALRVSSLIGAEFENLEAGEGSNNSRDVVSAYAELYLPLIPEGTLLPMSQGIELSLAARYEEYSDFGDSVDPKVGLVWSATESLRLRGTFGTSFRAPALTDLDTSNLNINSIVYFPQSLVDRGLIPFTTIFMTGGNENLTAESATTWTAGFSWLPERGFSLEVTYFDIDFEDRIGKPFTNLGLAYQDRFASFLNTNPTQEQLEALVNDPRWEERFGVPAADILSGAVPLGAIGDARTNNIAQSVVTGLDMQASYTGDAAGGTLRVGLNGNYLFDFERALVTSDPLIDEVDQLGRPVDFRARGYISWAGSRWATTTYLNYVDSFTDNVSMPARRVDSWLTADFTVSYDLSGVDAGLFSDLRMSFFVENLLDEDPPFADTIGGLAYDSSNASGRGRFVTLQIAKQW